MELNEYQKQTTDERVIWGDTPMEDLIICALGLSGEAGEVAGAIKKVARKDFSIEEKKELLKKELGDVLWYLSQLANDLGIDLEEVAQANIDKIHSRKKRGQLRGDGDNR